VVRNGKTTYKPVCGLTSLSVQQAAPAKLLALVQAHWKIENRCHWRRDVTLDEDACIVRHALVAVILALLNTTILAIFDIHKVTYARAMIRTFAAFPDQALALASSVQHLLRGMQSATIAPDTIDKPTWQAPCSLSV
jgi:hypothetical protein